MLMQVSGTATNADIGTGTRHKLACHFPNPNIHKPMKHFTVYYRIGGTENFQWKTCLPVRSEREAIQLRDEIRLMGYVAHYEDTELLKSVGLPTTYEPTTRPNR